MKQSEMEIKLEELEQLCLLYRDSRLTVLEEAELEFVLLCCDYDSPLIKETRDLMAVSHVLKLREIPHSHKSLRQWFVRVAACLVMVAGVFGVYRYIHPNVNDNCVVYISGKRANDEVARKVAEADVEKMRRFMVVVNRQKASEQAKVEEFMNHINKTR